MPSSLSVEAFLLVTVGVSANLFHGFGRLLLQNLFSLPGTSCVECPHTFVHLGGSHDVPHDRTPRHPHARAPRGAICRRGAASRESLPDRSSHARLLLWLLVSHLGLSYRK